MKKVGKIWPLKLSDTERASILENALLTFSVLRDAQKAGCEVDEKSFRLCLKFAELALSKHDSGTMWLVINNVNNIAYTTTVLTKNGAEHSCAWFKDKYEFQPEMAKGFEAVTLAQAILRKVDLHEVKT